MANNMCVVSDGPAKEFNACSFESGRDNKVAVIN